MTNLHGEDHCQCERLRSDAAHRRRDRGTSHRSTPAACETASGSCPTNVPDRLTSGIPMVWREHQVTCGRERLHEESRLRGAAMKAVGEDDDWQPANVVALRRPYGHVDTGKLDGSLVGVRDAQAKRPERYEKTADMPNLHGRRTIAIDDLRKLTGNETGVSLAQGAGVKKVKRMSGRYPKVA